MFSQSRCLLGLVFLGSLVGVLGRVASVNRDAMYLPDQADYLRSWTMFCEEEGYIYWPIDRQCYPEGARGPCFVQEVLLLDRRHLVPYCAQELPVSELSTSDLALKKEAPTSSKG